MNRCGHLTIISTLLVRICTIHVRIAAPVRQGLAGKQEYYAFTKIYDILKRSSAQWPCPMLGYPTPVLPLTY